MLLCDMLELFDGGRLSCELLLSVVGVVRVPKGMLMVRSMPFLGQGRSCFHVIEAVTELLRRAECWLLLVSRKKMADSCTAAEAEQRQHQEEEQLDSTQGLDLAGNLV